MHMKTAMPLPDWELILRLLLAAALGSVIGIERERLTWSAGLRTHMLVCVGACLVMIVSAYGFRDVVRPYVVLDPSRVAAQVVSGIGFLGAGAIILRNEVVKGLTTAASLWTVAAIGLAAGAGLYVAGVAATVIILVILAGLKPFEERYRNARQNLTLSLRARRGEMSVGLLEQALGPRAARVRQLVVASGDADDHDEVQVILTRVSPRDTAEIVEALRRQPCVLEIEEAGPAA